MHRNERLGDIHFLGADGIAQNDRYSPTKNSGLQTNFPEGYQRVPHHGILKSMILKSASSDL